MQNSDFSILLYLSAETYIDFFGDSDIDNKNINTVTPKKIKKSAKISSSIDFFLISLTNFANKNFYSISTD